MAFRFSRAKFILLLGFIFFIILYWSISVPGEVLFVPNNWRQINAWPQVRINSQRLQPDEEASLVVFDTVPWAHVKLIVAGTEGTLNGYDVNDSTGVYQWNWSFTVPDTSGYHVRFYHDCDTGCQAWTAVWVGDRTAPDSAPASPELIPTKLGVVFANPERNWYNRRGWNVELTYAQLAEEEYWGIDDLARRVKTATDKGLLVLVRVDYAQGQSIPPVDDHLALDHYLGYIRRLARDDRLEGVHGYVIGSGFNTSSGNSQASPQNMVTPAWYARVFNGYNVPVEHTDNVVQTIRAENPAAQVLVGPVTPWRSDQNGELTYQIDMPWLNYFNTLVSSIDQSVQDKAAAGINLTAPSGFAVQAPGRPNATELSDDNRAREPSIDLRKPEWDGAQAGFRVYQDWLDIINAYARTEGLPVYITSTNTYQPDRGVEPAQNYPPGWLSTALGVINREPQVVALCWFLDHFPHDDQWDLFSLTNPHGLMVNTADEFDRLLQGLFQ